MKVRKFILDSLLGGATLHGLAKQLNDLGVPPPRQAKKGEPHWRVTTIRNMVAETINYGVVYVNKYKRENGKMVKRPREEWTRLNCVVPALITKEGHDSIMQKLRDNRAESLRNNHHPDELGLLLGGYIFCAICEHRMTVRYGASGGRGRKDKPPYYRCVRVEGTTLGKAHNHRNTIAISVIDEVVKEKIIEALQKPEEVRAQVDAIRRGNKPVVDQEEITKTIATIRQKMQNLYRLVENATDDEAIVHLGERMHELEHQKCETEKLLYVLEDDEEERETIEAELQRFEKWAADVQPYLTDKKYMAKTSYAELRLAIKILGIRVMVYPLTGDYPFRYNISMTVPKALTKMNIVSSPSSV